MSKYKKLSHAVYLCTYHVVWTPKYRFRILAGPIGEMVAHEVRSLSEWLGCEVIELNVREDHVHVVVSIPPKVSVSEYLGVVKGKTAIKLFKSYPGMKKKPYWGNHFWARGYSCEHGRAGRRHHPQVRPVPGNRGEARREGRNCVSPLLEANEQFIPPPLAVVIDLRNERSN